MSSRMRKAGLAIGIAAVAALGVQATPAAARTTTGDPLTPLIGAVTPAATASPFAPVDRPGPALDVPQAQLDAAITCTATATHATRDVVLFSPGTTLTPQEDYGFTWFPAMDRLGFPYCSVTLPDNAMTDAQVSAEYIVNAVRRVHALSGRQVDVVGHSQGGLDPRFAIRFWPDIRPMIDDYVGLGATNHGSVAINALLCQAPVPGCAPALWQQTYRSRFTQATNSGQETFAGISYTDVYTLTDEFVQPNLDDSGTTSLHGGGGRITNVSVQSVCPNDVTTEHIAVGTYDPVAYALAIDAITHDGPADPARIAKTVCSQQLMPGVDPTTFATDYAALTGVIAGQLALAPRVAAEPPLKPFVYAS